MRRTIRRAVCSSAPWAGRDGTALSAGGVARHCFEPWLTVVNPVAIFRPSLASTLAVSALTTMQQSCRVGPQKGGFAVSTGLSVDNRADQGIVWLRQITWLSGWRRRCRRYVAVRSCRRALLIQLGV
jgi:hypothetical protein